MQLQSITNQLEPYYMALPKVSQVESADINTLFPPNNNTNNTSSNTTTTSVSYRSS